MSYAEHGSRIFLTGKFNSNSLLRYGDYVVPRKRSEGRLKLFDSCSDLRAWSSNSLENCRYFREIVENRGPSGRIVPYDILIETLILLGQTELASVRRQLEKYKSLRLTPEQEKQLQDIDDSTEGDIKRSDSLLLRETRIVEDESGIPKPPGTPNQSICSSSTNFHDVEIDNDSSADNNSEISKENSVSSEINNDNDRYNERSRIEDRSMRRYQGIIIAKDSKIISLKNELIAKETELEEIKDLCRNLESSLNESGSMLDNFRRNLKISQDQLLGMSDQLSQQKEEWKKKLYTSKCLVDHLKAAVTEKSQECSAQYQEIRDLHDCIKKIERVREERDSLGKKLDEMKIVLRERNDLLKLNEKQAISLADQEDEINRLLGFIQQTSMKYNKQEIRMKMELDNLRTELNAKNNVISQFEEQRVIMRTDLSPTGSMSQVPFSEIQKFKQALQEDLEAVENELTKRMKSHEYDDSRQEEMALRSKSTRDRMNETTQREKWEREKELMECTIEQLTMQVSATNATSEEQDAIHEKIVADFTNGYERIHRLVVELEPYVEQRFSLVDEIKRLREDREDAKRISGSRDLKTQKQYLSEVVNNHRRECNEYSRKILSLEKKLSDVGKKHGKLDEMDRIFDVVLVKHLKRSIETTTNLTAGLRGAGDEIVREKEKRRDEVEIRDAEITRLKEQVALHISRGQGGETNNENFNEIVRLKNEKKSLSNDLTTIAEALRLKRDELQSFEFKLKGSKQRINDLYAQNKQKDRDIQLANRQIERLEKEKEGLNKTVLITNDLAMEVDAMKIKLETLQEENSRLTNENTTMIKRCEDYKNRLVNFADREIQAKEAFDRVEFELQERAVKGEIEIEALRRENEICMRELKTNQLQMTKLTKEIEWWRKNNKVLNWMENLSTLMLKLNEDRKRLQDDVINMRYRLENDIRVNDKLEDDLKWQLSENEILENAIKELNDSIARASGKEMPEEIAKKLLNSLPDEIYERIENLRKGLSTTESEGISGQRKMEDLKIKTHEDDSIIENLREEIKSSQNNSSELDKRIVILEEANLALTKSLEKFKTNENSSSTNLEIEIGKKEHDIARLNRDIVMKNDELNALNDQVKSLIDKNCELTKELKNERDLRQAKFTELQQQYKTQLRSIHDEHNVSIKKLKAQYDEQANNEGKYFDSESWMRSLTAKETAELHRRICASNPCEITGEASNTRALNDKQNQQLQQDEKLHADALHIRKAHHKDSGFPYVYERRKFENERHRPMKKSFDDNTFGAQRKNFFRECAIQHKYDSSH